MQQGSKQETCSSLHKCSNKGCTNICVKRFCDDCYTTHKAELTKKCETSGCMINIRPSETHCTKCQPNTCRTCSRICRKMYCKECTEAYHKRKNTTATVVVPEIVVVIAATLEEKNLRHAENCSLAETKLSEDPCMECGVRACKKCGCGTQTLFCEPCTEDFALAKAQNLCPDCNIAVRPGTVYCWKCVKAFKMKPKNCKDCGVTTRGTYCSDCITAFKRRQSDE